MTEQSQEPRPDFRQSMTIGNEKYYMIMQYKSMSVITIHLKIFTTVAMIYFTEIQGRGSTHYHVLSIVSEKLV